MATLNIKDFPDALYRQLKARAKRERRSLSKEVTHLLRQVVDEAEPLSLLELRGLGKDLWQAADRHVERERATWD